MSASLACAPARCDPVPWIPAAVVPAAGTARRLQALAFMGHSVHELAGAAGIPDYIIRDARRGKAATVPVSLAAVVSAVYDALWDVRGGSQASARAARRHGWAPPLAWDDWPGEPHWIEDPAAGPAEWRRRDHLSVAQRREEIGDLAGLGCGKAETARRLGITRDALDQRRRRATRPGNRIGALS